MSDVASLQDDFGTLAILVSLVPYSSPNCATLSFVPNTGCSFKTILEIHV